VRSNYWKSLSTQYLVEPDSRLQASSGVQGIYGPAQEDSSMTIRNILALATLGFAVTSVACGGAPAAPETPEAKAPETPEAPAAETPEAPAADEAAPAAEEAAPAAEEKKEEAK
jgi:hypothetical protein